jgi:hypothetical protein
VALTRTNVLGGLERDFRVLFSAIFHGVSLRDFHQGRKQRILAEEKLWRFVAALHTKFLYVLVALPFHGNIKNPSLMRF